MLFCYQADSVRVAYSQLYRALTVSALHLDDYFTPHRTPLPVGIKLPTEGKHNLPHYPDVDAAALWR
ncbi:hypothetical protein NMD70_08395 [Edwardsiella tarda]|uniref:hypothetical protein n=1 Tax=Edwardsiella tarda TaxID=636 RepID=UPI00351C5E93